MVLAPRAALLSAALTCSCQPAPTVVSRATGSTPTVIEADISSRRGAELASIREPLRQAGRRPLLVATIPFEYASLPIEGPARPLAAVQRGSFTLKSIGQQGYSLHIAEDLLVEVEVGSRRFYSTSRARGKLFHPRLLPVERPPCGPGRGVAGTDTVSASWEGIRVSTWTDHEIEYVRYRGPFDLVSCHGAPASMVRTPAAALVPKLVYAYRSCSLGCLAGIDARAREEVLTIVAPPSWWLNATVSQVHQRRPHVGSFSHVRVPITRGGTASALLTFSGEDLGYFIGLRNPALRDLLEGEQLRDQILQLTIEAVWLEDEAAPTGTIYVAAPETPNADKLLRTVLPADLLGP